MRIASKNRVKNLSRYPMIQSQMKTREATTFLVSFQLNVLLLGLFNQMIKLKAISNKYGISLNRKITILRRRKMMAKFMKENQLKK